LLSLTLPYSLYPWIALTHEFPVGKYKILLDDIHLRKNITFQSGEFFYNIDKMTGDACHVTLIAPSTLERPYLQYRVNDEYSYLALCRTCVLKKIAKQCPHRANSSRKFSACYMMDDLAKAVTLGYEVLCFHEVHHYEKRDFILSPFMKILALEKLKNSNILANISPDSHNTFCEELNKKMNFQETQKLSPLNASNNEAQHSLYKSMLNGFCGRFALHSNFTRHIFCRFDFRLQIIRFM